VTPLFIAPACIEFSDIIFTIYSVPAIFALTDGPFIVLTSNIFAIISLRSLFFVLWSVVKAFLFLKYGLGVILVFVGLKKNILAQRGLRRLISNQLITRQHRHQPRSFDSDIDRWNRVRAAYQT